MSYAGDLDVQYSPNRWSKRYRAEEVVKKHVEFVTKVSSLIRRKISCEYDVAYGETDREKIDIFGIDLPDDSPILIFIHGGGYWNELSKDISSFMVEPLYKRQFKVIIVGYTLRPQATISQIIEQIQKAFLNCLEYAKNYNSRALYICGHSTGAHLVANLFQTFFETLPTEDQEILKAVYLISGLYDLKPLLKTYLIDSLELDNKTAKQWSPLLQKFYGNKNTIFFLIVGENDTPVYKHQSESFCNKLKNLGYKSELIVVNEVDHFDIVEHMNEEHYEIVRLISNFDSGDY